ncbi:MAG: helix-turn-helix domain-containing protein [Pseudomonadota bacterium]
MIADWDFLLRIVTIGAGLMLLALCVAGEIRTAIKVPLVGMIIGVIGYLLNATPLMSSTNSMDPWVDLLAMSVPFWIWLFARRLFEREPPRRVIYVAAALMLFTWLVGNFFALGEMLAFYVLHAIGLALIADLVRVALLGRDDDLVEQRRVIRLWLPLLVAAQAGGILTFELILGGTRDFPVIQIINTLLILIITLFAGLALFRTDPELLIQSEADIVSEDDEPLDLSPSETVLHEKLTTAMADGAYRETGLTIAMLAEQLDTPEHRLRALINQRLGHRNFSAFLNRHRIAEAREKLADRNSVDLPVLTIAMDLGYNSLPTFNRAFRAETGTTPSEFRRNAIGPEDAPAPLAEPATAANSAVQN